MNDQHPKLTKEGGVLSLSQVIGCGYPCERRSFHLKENLNYNQEAMGLSKFLSASMTMRTSSYNVSASFNVANLSPFDVGDDSRANLLEEEGDDVT